MVAVVRPNEQPKDLRPDIPEELSFLRPESRPDHKLTESELKMLKQDLDLSDEYNEIHYLTWQTKENSHGCTLKEEDDLETELWQIRNSIRHALPFDPKSFDEIEKSIKHCEYEALLVIDNERRIAEDYLLLTKATLFLLFVFGWSLTMIGRLSKAESVEMSSGEEVSEC